MSEYNQNEVTIIPEYDDNGTVNYHLPNAKTDKNLVAVCPKVADKVIPVIFIPGVMGSNLKDKNGREIWRADFYKGLDMIGWGFKNGKERKELLNHKTTFVDDKGKILYNEQVDSIFPSRKKRGWGTALYLSYGEMLEALQFMLNDQHLLLENLAGTTKHLTSRQQLIGENMGAELGEEPLTDEEVRHSYEFLFPLHVFGYNWLQSNSKSAQKLDEFVSDVLELYCGRLAVEKVILITHSMGGLVARHYSENMAGRNKILGIIHGVMPDLGSPATYRRMKTGERGLFGAIIGSNAEELMPVLAQSPGPLQLLPGKAYGSGWLKIKSDGKIQSKPQEDPYEEIYLNEQDWWRLCEKALLLGDEEKEWGKYIENIKYNVKVFIEELNGKYHPQTWAFYGAGSEHPSEESLTWYERPYKLPLPTYRESAGKKFELTSSASPGDGTVPVKSGRIGWSGLRSLLATNVDHEGAYASNIRKGKETSLTLKFTLRAIVKMVQSVPGTGGN